MRCVVTGGAGFIGSNITRALLKENAKVRILDNFSTGKKENLASIDESFELIEGDLRDANIVMDSLKGVDAVFHQGALPSVLRSVECPQDTNDINITGTLNVLIAAQKNGVKRVVFASSSSVYGDSPTLPKREDMIPSPLSPYALSKLTGEYYCAIFNNLMGVETVSLRYFNVYGPYQDPDSEYAAVIPKFIVRMIGEKRPIIYGDGEQSRDFTYVKDVVDANLKAAIAGKDALGNVLNIAVGSRTTVNKLAKEISIILGEDMNPEYQDSRPGDVKHSLADVAKAQEFLHFSALTNLEDGLRETVEWYQETLGE